MKQVVLIASVGRTDLQVLARRVSDEALVRLSVGRGLRGFHQALLSPEGRLTWTLDDSYSECPEAGRDHELHWDVQKGALAYPAGYEPLAGGPESPVLVPGKLAPAVNALKQWQEEWQVESVLLLTTRREQEGIPGGVYMNEPVAAAPIVARWLAEEHFELDVPETPGDIGRGRAGWIHILDDDMLSPAPGRDTPVNREALRRIETAIRGMLNEMDGEPWACLSLGGGMPEMKEPVRACAEFFFSGNTFNWHAPQYSDDFRWVEPGVEPPGATDSYRIRRHVENLVRRGALLEAYGAASELEEDPEEEKWISTVRCAADYLTGALPRGKKELCNYPSYIQTLSRPYENDQKRVGPRCLLVGMRVEAAYWARRIPEAVAASVTFFDAAALDAIEQALPDQCELNDKREIIQGHWEKLDPLEGRVNHNVPKNVRPPLSLLRTQEGDRIFGYTVGAGNFRRWKRILDNSVGRAVGDYLQALRGEGAADKHTISPMRLRHISTHSVLTASELKEALNAMSQAGVWNASPGHPGEAFLSQRLTAAVFESLGLTDVDQLYRSLIEGVINDLRGHEIQ